jgi:hypothetical protein
VLDYISLDDDNEAAERLADSSVDADPAADRVLEAVTREDATRSASSFHPALFRFLC